MTKEERFKKLDEVADKAVKGIQEVQGWIDSIKGELTKSEYAWKQISGECDSLIADIDFQLGKEQEDD